MDLFSDSNWASMVSVGGLQAVEKRIDEGMCFCSGAWDKNRLWGFHWVQTVYMKLLSKAEGELKSFSAHRAASSSTPVLYWLWKSKSIFILSVSAGSWQKNGRKLWAPDRKWLWWSTTPKTKQWWTHTHWTAAVSTNQLHIRSRLRQHVNYTLNVTIQPFLTH